MLLRSPSALKLGLQLCTFTGFLAETQDITFGSEQNFAFLDKYLRKPLSLTTLTAKALFKGDMDDRTPGCHGGRLFCQYHHLPFSAVSSTWPWSKLLSLVSLASFLTSKLAKLRKENKLGRTISKVPTPSVCVFIRFYKLWKNCAVHNPAAISHGRFPLSMCWESSSTLIRSWLIFFPSATLLPR